MEHEHTQHVAAPPDRVFSALADVSNLPRYVPQMTAAQRLEGDRVKIQARYEGHTQEGEGWLRTDESQRTIEWGSDASAYHGRIKVNGDENGSRLTLFLATAHGRAPDSEAMGTLDAIRRLVEADT